MSDQANAPAFPCGESYTLTDLIGNVTKHSKAPLFLGVSQRAFLAAHAPYPPPDWFEPQMEEKPIMRWATAEDGDKRARRYVENYAEIEAWEKRWQREKVYQWPLAWADEVMGRMA